jgi:hypothetical protein
MSFVVLLLMAAGRAYLMQSVFAEK